jgi:hypothetical protein
MNHGSETLLLDTPATLDGVLRVAGFAEPVAPLQRRPARRPSGKAWLLIRQRSGYGLWITIEGRQPPELIL